MTRAPQPGLIQLICSCFLPPGYICMVQTLLAPIPPFMPEYTKDLYLFGDFSAHLVRGLSFLHSFGIIHGDLKPENVMMACSISGSFATNMPIRPYIIDLGNSLTINDLKFVDKDTPIQPILYRAPEVGLAWFFMCFLGYDQFF